MPKTKRTPRPLPEQARLRELFHYEPETGEVTRIAKSGHNGIVGEVVGSTTCGNYLSLRVDGTLYMLHRLIYVMMTGDDPGERQIDHINGDRGRQPLGKFAARNHSG